jgi:hypothetical protein
MKYNSLSEQSVKLIKTVIAYILLYAALISLPIANYKMLQYCQYGMILPVTLVFSCIVLLASTVGILVCLIHFTFEVKNNFIYTVLTKPEIVCIHADNSIVLSFIICKIFDRHEYKVMRSNPTDPGFNDKVCIYCGDTILGYTNLLRLRKKLEDSQRVIDKRVEKNISKYYIKLTKEEQKEVFVETL